MKWPAISEMPVLMGVFCEEVIEKCWNGNPVNAQNAEPCMEWPRTHV